MSQLPPLEWLQLLKRCFNQFVDDKLESHQGLTEVALTQPYHEFLERVGVPLTCQIPPIWLLWLSSIHHQCVNHRDQVVLFGPSSVLREVHSDLEQFSCDEELQLLPERIRFPVCLPIGSHAGNTDWYIICDPQNELFGAILELKEMPFWEASGAHVVCPDFQSFLAFLAGRLRIS